MNVFEKVRKRTCSNKNKDYKLILHLPPEEEYSKFWKKTPNFGKHRCSIIIRWAEHLPKDARFYIFFAHFDGLERDKLSGSAQRSIKYCVFRHISVIASDSVNIFYEVLKCLAYKFIYLSSLIISLYNCV